MTALASRLVEHLNAGVVALDIRASDLDEVVTALLDRSPLSLEERAACREALRGRPAPAIGHGLILPHARVPGLQAPLVAWGRLERPLTMPTPDGDPVSTVALLLFPPGTPPEDHLDLLMALARAMSDPFVRAEVERAPSPEAIIAALSRTGAAPSTPPPEDPLAHSGRLASGLAADLRRLAHRFVGDLRDGSHCSWRSWRSLRSAGSSATSRGSPTRHFPPSSRSSSSSCPFSCCSVMGSASGGPPRGCPHSPA